MTAPAPAHQLAGHVARLLYDRQLGRVEIAERLGISRFGVARLIDEALAEGLVRIEHRDVVDQRPELGRVLEDHRAGTDAIWHYLPDRAAVDIPYRTLVVRDAANVPVAGPFFGATHDAHAAVRSMAQCISMGQAAGTAAAVAIESGRSPRDVPIVGLRARLGAAGAILDLEGAAA